MNYYTPKKAIKKILHHTYRVHKNQNVKLSLSIQLLGIILNIDSDML